MNGDMKEASKARVDGRVEEIGCLFVKMNVMRLIVRSFVRSLFRSFQVESSRFAGETK